jgi:ubiquinone/menaquinone biosynthesis C-methylase UbiE
MPLFRKLPGGVLDLAVSMVGVKLGDRLLQVGCGDGRLLAALAAKVGLTGQACAVDSTPGGVERGRAGAARGGALVELAEAPYGVLPHDAAAFDIVVLYDVMAAARNEDRRVWMGEVMRVLRPGGRVLIVDRLPRAGLAALLGQPASDPSYAAAGGAPGALAAAGCLAVRVLSERAGFRFSEGVRPRG